MVDYGYCIIYTDELGQFCHTFFGRPVVGGSDPSYFKCSPEQLVSFIFFNAYPDCSLFTLFPLTYSQYKELFS